MQIGIPVEVKPLEGRVALTPEACGELVSSGHEVFLQTGAGLASGYRDKLYEEQGVRLCSDAASLYESAKLIVKVKEPYGTDLEHLKAHHLLFCFLHLAADAALAEKMCEIGLTALGFETLQRDNAIPILGPMSRIAGKIAVQIGTHLLHQPMGGRGILLGGVDETEPGNVLVLGCGQAGGAAAMVAAELGARVTVLDINEQAMQRVTDQYPQVQAETSNRETIMSLLPETDLLVGSILLPGARAPHLVSREMIATMPEGSVAVDIAIDQGGCVETSHAMTYEDPVYTVEGVQHFSVTNMPGAVPRTSTQALSAVLLPEVKCLAGPDWTQDEALQKAVNLRGGEIANPVILEAINDK
ncbi:MAG: alanine dehydrogenase [Gammaproteobacteria bacterium]|nr:alanine dehydrogenase [Gammaproteobacteria bacterium]